MEVILLERIEKLGQMGDVVSVKSGYARNYLLPQKKALRATESNRKLFEKRRVQLEATNLERRVDAEAVGAKFHGVTVILLRQAGDAGQLYGSVNTRDIARELVEAGFTVTRQQVRLEHTIKSVGLHSVRVDLHPEVSVTVTANVARSPQEAEQQTKTGRAVRAGADDGADAEAGTVDDGMAARIEAVFEDGAAPAEEDAATVEPLADGHERAREPRGKDATEGSKEDIDAS